MTGNRQVFPRDQVAHLWAHRAQDSARDPSRNFFFTGSALYSYGSHFCVAYILGDECGPELAGRILWNDATYSSTTTTMQTIAWRALTGQQKQNALHMPRVISMGNNTNPLNIARALAAKKLPEVTPLILECLVDSVLALRGKRYLSGPFTDCLHEAQKAETLARAFYSRAGRKYPLPLLETRPTSSAKAEWLEWIKAIAIGKMRKDYAETLANIKNYSTQAERNAAECTDGFPYVMVDDMHARNVVQGTFDVAGRAIREIQKAQTLHKDIHGKAGPASLKKTKARMVGLAQIFGARRDEFNRRETQARLIRDIREAARFARSLRQSSKDGLPRFARRFQDMETLKVRAETCQLSNPLYLGLAARLSRIGSAVAARHSLNEANGALNLAQSYFPEHPSDAKRNAVDAVNKLRFIARLNIASKLYSHLTPEIERIQSVALTLANNAQAAILTKHAETLRAWLAGESNTRPSWEVGTFARIKGDAAETSRGASVPIVHACRLSRLYSVVVKRGGQEWKDGAGPLVGHYRVNRIGADGSLVIGCHEFDASEAKRLRELLASCAECQGVEA